LYIRRIRKQTGQGKKWQTAIGCFETMFQGQVVADADIKESVPKVGLLSEEKLESLVEFLAAQKSNGDVIPNVPRTELEDAIATIQRLEHELDKVKRENRKRPVSPNAEEPSSSRQKKTMPLHFILGGEAGVIEIVSGQTQISVESLISC
jgi:hypothetical protein